MYPQSQGGMACLSILSNSIWMFVEGSLFVEHVTQNSSRAPLASSFANLRTSSSCSPTANSIMRLSHMVAIYLHVVTTTVVTIISKALRGSDSVAYQNSKNPKPKQYSFTSACIYPRSFLLVHCEILYFPSMDLGGELTDLTDPP